MNNYVNQQNNKCLNNLLVQDYWREKEHIVVEYLFKRKTDFHSKLKTKKLNELTSAIQLQQ